MKKLTGLLLEEVPGDGEAGAGPPEAVDVPAEGGPHLLLVFLLHVVHVSVMSLPKRAARQAGVGLGVVVVARDRVGGGDGGLVNHSWGLTFAGHRAGWLVLAVAALEHCWGRSALGDHLGVVLRQDLGHVGHCPVA